MTSSLSAPALGETMLRVALGAMWISHGLLKMLVFTLLGGAAILLGFFGRQTSLLLSPILIVAAWVHLPNGWVFSNANGGWEYPAFLLVASLAHWLLGDGQWSLRTSAVLAPA